MLGGKSQQPTLSYYNTFDVKKEEAIAKFVKRAQDHGGPLLHGLKDRRFILHMILSFLFHRQRLKILLGIQSRLPASVNLLIAAFLIHDPRLLRVRQQHLQYLL